jgi:hypothetical protein
MKIAAPLGGIVIAGVLSVSLSEAQPLKYLGRQEAVPAGWIEFGHGMYHEIGVGTEIPPWGHIVEVRDDRIVVEQLRTEADKQRMKERGALVHDVLEMHILREDLRLLPTTPPAR